VIQRRLIVLGAFVLAACGSGGSGPSASGASPGRSTTIVVSEPASSATATTVLSSGAAAATAPSGPCGGDASAPKHYDHVVWIWMENHTAGAVFGSEAATFERDLASRCGSGTSYRAVGSPSLPNYLAATSGSTHGIHDDGSPAAHPIAGDNLFRQVRNSGGTARSYEEAMPRNCELHGGGRYAVKHNPQAYYADPPDRDACQRDNVPLGSLTAGALVDDLAHDRLPTFSFITPDLCNDTHDCSVEIGDRWLEAWLGLLVGSATYGAGRTAIFVAWDEPTPMPLLVISPTVPSGTSSSAPFDHYSLLHTTEELLGLSPYLGQAAAATSMRDEFGL
jgi:phosphatidylinositol-3-phosphatase